jgi:hypothetical protein
MDILVINEDNKQRDNISSALITINILLERNNFEDMNEFQNDFQLTKTDIIKSMWPSKRRGD